MTLRAFEVNPSPEELALGQLEQWRRSKMSKAWKNVLVSLVKGHTSMEDTSLCVWRKIIGDNGSNSLELLQQIPMREVQWVDFDTHIHPSAGSTGGSGGEMNRFALSLYQATEDVIFRAPDDPVAVRDWVTTLKTVQQYIQNAKANGASVISQSSQTQTHTQNKPQASQPQPQVDLLSFDHLQIAPPDIPVHYGANAAPPSKHFQQPHIIYQQPQVHQPWQHQPQSQPVYPQQQPNTFGTVGPMKNQSSSSVPPQGNLNQPRSYSPPPLSFHNNPYAPQPHFNMKPKQPTQHSTPVLNTSNPRQWNPSPSFSTTAQHRPVQTHPPPINFNNNGSNNSTGIPQVHHHQQHRAHTAQQQGRAPAPIPRPTTGAKWAQSQPTATGIPQQQQPQQNHERQHNRPPHRSHSAPIPKTHENSVVENQRQTAMKQQVIRDWALQPPQLQQLKPLSELIRTIPKVFPPHAAYVTPHEYFQKWDTSAMFDLNNNTDKGVRKLRFFLHPDKLPKNFTQDQIFLCKILWDVVNDAQQMQEGTKK
jgi:hypothetical protein